MKKVVMIFICLFFCIAVNAESINDTRCFRKDTHKKEFNEENFPVMYNYFKDYLVNLYHRYDPALYPYPGFLEGDGYYILRDGTIDFGWKPEDPEELSASSRRMRKFLLENPPPPFPKEMTDEKIWMDVNFITVKKSWKNKITMYNSTDGNDSAMMTLTIDKSIKYKNMTRKKCLRWGHEWSENGNFCILPYDRIYGLRD